LLSKLFIGILSTARKLACALFYLFYLPLRARDERERQMKNRMSVSELSAGLGYPSSATVQGLRLWKAFTRLSPSQRSEVLALIEDLATDGPTPRSGGMNGRPVGR
jgi:hypothetical protein